MDLASFEQLLTETGQAALMQAAALLAGNVSLMAGRKRLEKTFPAELARTALLMAGLRIKARDKFARADLMYFTREALEQASSEIVSTYRARRFQAFERVGDLGCGIGGDTFGLARQTSVVAVEHEPLRLAIVRENVRALELTGRVTLSGANLTETLPDVSAAFCDPSRRAAGRRFLDVEQYQPPLSTILQWRERIPALGIKLAPGVALTDIDGLDAEVEFISVSGELKECVLWFGPLRGVKRRATLLPAGATMTDEGGLPPARLAEPLAYLYDPDPALSRAGLVARLATELDAYQLDPGVAYLTAAEPRPTPFARLYAIAEALPFHAKKLRERLRQLDVGSIDLKRRGSPVEPIAFERSLKLKGNRHCVVVLTRVTGAPFALIGTPVQRSQS